MKVMLTTNGRRAAVFFCFLLLSVAGVMGVFTDRSSAQSKPKGNGRSEIGAIQVGEPSIPTISVRADSLPEYRIPDGPIIEVNPRRTRPHDSWGYRLPFAFKDDADATIVAVCTQSRREV